MQMPIFPQGESHNPLFRGRQTVFEELDRHGLNLAEHDVAARPDHKCGVIVVAARGRVLAADDQVTPVLPAPLF